MITSWKLFFNGLGYVNMWVEITFSLHHLDICSKHLDSWVNCFFLLILLLSSCLVQSRHLSSISSLLTDMFLSQFLGLFHFELVCSLRKRRKKKLTMHCFSTLPQDLCRARWVMYHVLFSRLGDGSRLIFLGLNSQIYKM